MNQENNYNQNFNNENSNNNVNVPVQNNDEKEKKSYCSLVVVFMVISLLLTGYIVYDKTSKKELPVEPKNEVNEPVKTELVDCQTSEVGISDFIYPFKTETITKVVNGKSKQIRFDYYLTYDLEEDDDGFRAYYIVSYDVLIDEKKVTSGRANFESNDASKYTTIGIINNLLKPNNSDMQKINKQVQDIGIIKGDKDYLYIRGHYFGRFGEESNVLVFDDDNNVIFKENLSLAGSGLTLDKLCPNIEKFDTKPTSNDDTYYLDGIYYTITDDAIYYIGGRKMDSELKSGDSLFDEHKIYFKEFLSHGVDSLEVREEYKVEFKNDKAVETKIGSCVGYGEGAVY